MCGDEYDVCGPDPSCIGSSLILQTYDGPKKCGDIIPGEKILTWNIKNNSTEYQPMFGFAKHIIVKNCPHFEITTMNGDIIVITKSHNIYKSDSTLVQAWKLSVGDELKTVNGFDIIKSINIIDDLPLSPLVEQGNIITGNGTVVSCWEGDEEDINLMNSLMKIIKGYFDIHTLNETTEMINKVCMTFDQFFYNNKKPVFKIMELIRKYEENINLMNWLIKIIIGYIDTHTVNETVEIVNEIYKTFTP